MAGFSFCNITPISAFISPFSTRILFLYLGHQCVFVAQRQQRITGVVNKDATLISSAPSPTYTLQTREERKRERVNVLTLIRLLTLRCRIGYLLR